MDFNDIIGCVPTPYNEAGLGEIADVVLMPGDPGRSRWIAEAFLENAELVNNVRGMQCYTGTWKGHRVTTMASGVGIPSISLFAYELFNFYDVKTIIRVGTAGSIRDDVRLGDVIICNEAYTTSNFLQYMNMQTGRRPEASQQLMEDAAAAASGMEIAGNVHIGPVLTEDLYYTQADLVAEYQAKGVLAFEMETAALYALAEQAGKNALAVFTVSNEILKGLEMSREERERNLTNMVEIALRAAFAG